MKNQLVLFAHEKQKVTSSVLHSIAPDEAEIPTLILRRGVPANQRLRRLGDVSVNTEDLRAHSEI